VGRAALRSFLIASIALAAMTSPPARPPRETPSLRTELLSNLAFLAAGALVLAVVTALLAPIFSHNELGIGILVVLIVADLAVFIGFGRYLVARLVTGPVDRLVDATQAVADGELARRAPAAGTREFDRLAASVNRMTDRLLDAQSLLVRAEKLASVGRLAAGVAHEVGNPLSAIDNYLEVLRRRGAEPELVAAIGREADRIDVIVRSLLDYARPRDVQRDPLDLGDVMESALQLLDAQGVLRPVTVARSADPDLPRVRGDRPALEQVFVNLLLNAVDAAGAGGRIAVRLSPTARDAQSRNAPAPRRRATDVPDGVPGVEVVVADSGPGVAVELRDRIFDPFFTTKEPGRGTGLGLAIVQRIVHDHGGRVDVGTGELGGASFTVTLPAAAP
jgi:two-component system NtrC family sensor kinase